VLNERSLAVVPATSQKFSNHEYTQTDTDRFESSFLAMNARIDICLIYAVLENLICGNEVSRKKKYETITTARKDIDAFYKLYNRKTDKQRATQRKRRRSS
jgi:hypothetical protein